MVNAAARQRGDSKCNSGEATNGTGAGDEMRRTNPRVSKIGSDAAPVRVLLVEDSPVVRERLVALLGELANVVVIGQASDGFQALALFRQHHPDTVVLDIQLPGINGFDLLARFKEENPECLVIVLTTYPFMEFRQHCIALKADHFFDKSTEFEQVAAVLGRWEAPARLTN